MTYTDNFFYKLPTKEDKSDRSRKYNLIKADLNISEAEAVKKISNDFFTDHTAKALMDPMKCALMLQKIMSSTRHMENLSDFVAICFVYTYKNHQSQPQSIGLLRHCLQKDFKFEDQELDLMIKTMIEDPPKNATDIKFCSQIIALICKKSDFCKSFLVERYNKDKYPEDEAKFLKAISIEISHDTRNFSEADLKCINRELIIDQSMKKEVKKKTPNEEKIFKKAEKNIKVDSLYSKLQSYDKLIFIIITILILIIIISFV